MISFTSSANAGETPKLAINANLMIFISLCSLVATGASPLPAAEYARNA